VCRHGLAVFLVMPARGERGGSANPCLISRGVGQIDDMVGHAELLTPGRLAAGVQLVVAAFRAHDADVTACQLGHAGVTVALAVAFLGSPAAVHAMDFTQCLQPYRAAEQLIQWYLLLAQGQTVIDGFTQSPKQLADAALTTDERHQGRVPLAGVNRDSSGLAGAFAWFLQVL